MYRVIDKTLFSALAILGSAAIAVAQEPAPAPAPASVLPKVVTVDGQKPIGQGFRLVKVERRPVGQKINIQITPDEQYDVTKKVETRLPQWNMGPVGGGTSDVDTWFWNIMSTDLSEGNGSRMQEAMLALQNQPGSDRSITPDIKFMHDLATKYGRDILLGTLNREVSPAFVLAVMGVESAGKANAVSSAGATGLMQLIPDTAKRFGVKEITDPAQNIAGGAAYLEWLLKEFKQDPLLALAGYNAGENAVKKHDGVPPFDETRAYVPKVVAAWQVARNLCQTPPDYVWQGCVFRAQGPKL
jgi:hypothetical protein